MCFFRICLAGLIKLLSCENDIEALHLWSCAQVTTIFENLSLKKNLMEKYTYSKEKGEGLRNIQNTGRQNHSALASRQVTIYSLGFYVLILLPSLWYVHTHFHLPYLF